MKDIEDLHELIDNTYSICKSIIQNDFSDKERKEFLNIMKYLKTDFKSFITNSFIVFNLEELKSLKSPSLSFTNKHSDESIRYFEKFYGKIKAKKLKDENLAILLHRMSLIYQSIINNEYINPETSEEIKEIISKLENRTLVLGQRYGMDRDLNLDTNVPARTFRLKEKYYLKATILFVKLKAHKFITDTSKENFEIAFSIIKYSKNFEKINWNGSILELKYFIETLKNNKIIEVENNYFSFMTDCFMIKKKELFYNQIKDSRKSSSSNRNFHLIDEITNLT
ncbi:hypothetical protein ACFO3U_04365 [Flavobacterium ponti]|uniref:RteC protein n=1 Tax=Flavobacterium ponti TaxID=665133 RepID=A0ABV9P0U9_9FLAO